MEKKGQILSDYHIHTPYCGHAHGKIIEYVETAIDKGLTEICFTDHLGRYYLSESQKKRYWDWGMSANNLARYHQEIENLTTAFSDRIKIRTGLEIDYIEGAEDLLHPILKQYNFDFLLGSVHCLPVFGWKHLTNYSREDVWPLFEQYFIAAKGVVSSGLFNGLAHIDFIWRYAKWPHKKSTQIFDFIDDIVKTAARNNVAIEINSNGYLWSQIYNVLGGDPFEIVLEKIKEYNTPVTIGSDAHKPEFVAKAFPEVAQLFKAKGLRTYCSFEKQEKRIRHLS